MGALESKAGFAYDDADLEETSMSNQVLRALATPLYTLPSRVLC